MKLFFLNDLSIQTWKQTSDFDNCIDKIYNTIKDIVIKVRRKERTFMLYW